MTVSAGPFCGALGCTDEADVIVYDGEREYYACDEHAEECEVVDDV